MPTTTKVPHDAPLRAVLLRTTTLRTTTLGAATLGAALLALAGCSGDAPPTSPTATPTVLAPDVSAAPPAIEPGSTGTVALGDRPFALTVPDGYDPATPVPLVVGLHGYTSKSADLVQYLGLDAQSQSEGFLLAAPDGTTDAHDAPFWNATNACCNFFGAGIDDSAYLADVIATVEAQYAVDPARVVVVGHSNGGFMALRMACEHADVVTAVASIAGAQVLDPADCDPARPVNVLQVHGSSDETIAYDGGSNGGGRQYPGAVGTVEAWRALDGCTAEPQDGEPLDLEAAREGAETSVRTSPGCADGTEVALWTIDGGRHVPTWTDAGREAIVGWLLDHPREG
ncbi:putative lipoprotein [Xylanimonas cellulosilytica DSM 15894]|uniref:Lipoprotein n=1 Tax=Xylanimonas cellulosilytica (strain DSM 15894 / JCM 12276 / CECT 5975 / KCTC 9989 / LMG 20990 / NBRC 107835 / XIL07) TaxID=446471 RepID=D1BZX9_XYLCX|nr:alpha/beta fold hydrolase [Xylanimonas cellulosilytica]ACZ32107.1 putative lipoprotein [Xylanimonas cellulosilytica DSM 15894]